MHSIIRGMVIILLAVGILPLAMLAAGVPIVTLVVTSAALAATRPITIRQEI